MAICKPEVASKEFNKKDSGYGGWKVKDTPGLMF